VTGTKPNRAKSQKSAAQQHLEELIRIATDVARAKGWHVYLQSSDKEKFRFATVNVSKYFGGAGDVTATFEFTCQDKIKLSACKTSFYGHGVEDLRDAIWAEVCNLSWLERTPPKKPESIATSEVDLVARILRRVHQAVRQMKHRHDDRPGITISDEYDVQDFLHALLRALFDDIRTEEYCPSYAGGASRIDFFLKSASIAIEVKVASVSLKDKKIGEQLMIDVQRYQAHPGCKTLFCLVYDPHGELRNPAGLEADLTKKYDSLDVRVVVVSPS
jgi:DNA-binding sugar fermentation-stimulating protein